MIEIVESNGHQKSPVNARGKASDVKLYRRDRVRKNERSQKKKKVRFNDNQRIEGAGDDPAKDGF